MKIIKIDFWREDLNLKKPYTISYETIDFVENIFLKLNLKMELGVLELVRLQNLSQVKILKNLFLF